ncbi:MAG: SurA N-terminal domain-containing protein [Victivallales bacterium]|nr:SurA N-terminal domain-containing protein [Victivallales bacterium]
MIFKRYIAICTVLALSMVSTLADNDLIWQFIPGKAASVNGRIISKSELLATMFRLQDQEQYRRMNAAELKIEATKVVNQIINKMLIEELFKKHEIKVSPEELEDKFKRMVSSMTPLQKDIFMKNLRSMNLSLEAYTAQVRNDPDSILMLKQKKLINKLFPGRLDIPESRAEEFYRLNQTSFRQPEGISISRIFISGNKLKAKLKQQHPDMGDTELTFKADTQARELISQLYAGLLAQANFGELATKHSHCPSASRQGFYGIFSRKDNSGEDELFKLRPGQFTPIQKIEGGYQILFINEHIPESYTPFAEVKDFIIEDMQTKIVQAISDRIISEARRKKSIEIFF